MLKGDVVLERRKDKKAAEEAQKSGISLKDEEAG